MSNIEVSVIKMHKDTIRIITLVFIALPYFTLYSATAGTPAQEGKGPGMGRDYQKQTPGPGRGGPDYRGGDAITPAPVEETGDGSPQTPANRDAVPAEQRRGRPGPGRNSRG